MAQGVRRGRMYLPVNPTVYFKMVLEPMNPGSSARRYYPGVDIVDEISTEADRVKFLQSVAQVMLTKARMKLNIKKLYSADGLAVKELLKVASLLYKATEKAAFDEEVGPRACIRMGRQ